ncbi:FAD/NAD(P)-binding protein [Longivirga aurantiaca]|uniref:FAD/NAD(P)-binding protein n=1 Tax=Longivirga aurantiaca TaxID=1837743 RepID=A0ABW1T0C4_9ACTN
MQPRRFVVRQRRQDTSDTATYVLEPLDGRPLLFTPGQFTMLGRLGTGEVPISISGDPASPLLVHTVRDVGGATHLLLQAQVGDVLEVRGPYGTGWRVGDGRGGDVLVVAGGIGLAPLRPAVLDLLAHRDDYRSAVVLYGARSPTDRLYPDELEAWSSRGVDVQSIVDHGTPDWPGRVGLVTSLLAGAPVDPASTLALVCGPEVMIRYVSRSLVDLGVAPDRIRVSMERNMKCGVGLCGHCQLRGLFVCTDGPVLPYSAVAPLIAIREV